MAFHPSSPGSEHRGIKRVSMTVDKVEDEEVYQAYMDLDKTLKESVNKGFKQMLPYFMDANGHLNTSSSCKRDLLHLMSGVRKLKISALNFIDASGKLPDSVLRASINMLGDYDQCLNSSLTQRNGSMAFRGKYCFLAIKTKTAKNGLKNFTNAFKNASELIQYVVHMTGLIGPYPFGYGVCVPSTCTVDDIEDAANYLFQKTVVQSTVLYCDVEEGTTFPPGKVIAIIVYSIFGLLLIIGTLLDYYTSANKLVPKAFSMKLLLCFSILKNFPKLIETKGTRDSLTSLNGIRVLSLLYIILLHHYLQKVLAPFELHVLHYIEDISSFFFQIVSNGFLTVEVFFFVGGLVHIYSRMKDKETSKGGRPFIHVLIHRLFRIYPTYIFNIFLIYLMNDFRGPSKYFVQSQYTYNCDQNWWKNMLFINNFFEPTEMCLPQSWYLSADMQLFLLSSFIFFIISWQPSKAIILNVGMIIIGTGTTIVWAYHKDMLPGLILYNWNFEVLERTQQVYFSTLPHAAPYFTGMLVGYILHTKKAIKISKLHQFLGWIISSVLFTSMLFLTRRWSTGLEYTRMESALYFSFSRFLYVAAVGWMVICCANGYGGIINYILSLKIWIPLSRMSYMIYLLSPTIQTFFYGNIRAPPDSHIMISIWHYLAEVVISCLLGLVLVVTVESPLIAIENLLRNKESAKGNQNIEEHAEAHDNGAFEGNNIKSIELEKNANNINVIQDRP